MMMLMMMLIFSARHCGTTAGEKYRQAQCVQRSKRKHTAWHHGVAKRMHCH
jgi:hypothetical protein